MAFSGAPKSSVTVHKLDNESTEPLWSQLVKELVRLLDSGAYRNEFPSEHELMAMFDVSRYTVREALRQLIAQGRLHSIKGRGTFVSPWHDQFFASSYSLAKEISKTGQVESSAVLRQLVVKLDRDLPILNLSTGDSAVYVERVRYASGNAVALNRSWFPTELAFNLVTCDLTSGSIYEVLQRECQVQITGGWERIRTSVPDFEDRNLLELDANVPVLSLERAAYTFGEPAEWRESLVRDDRFYLVAQWGSELWQSQKMNPNEAI